MASLGNKPYLFGRIENEILTFKFVSYDTFNKQFVNVSHDSTSSVKETIDPQEFNLLQSYPNPFNPVTNITYTIAKASPVELSIFNPLGQLVITLVSERQSAGRYTYQWHANSLGGGFYLCRLTTGQFEKTIKVVLLK